MLDKENYRQYVKEIRERWNSLYKTSLILDVSIGLIRKIEKWEEISTLSKFKIMAWYDEWVSKKVLKFNKNKNVTDEKM